MIRLLVMLFILLAIPARAQPEGDAQPAVDVTPTSAPTQQSGQQKTTEQEAATPPAEGPSISAEGSPLNYESSEQISEDLSVSFPVDI